MKKGKYVKQTEKKQERKIDEFIYYIIIGLLIGLPLMQLVRMGIAGRGNYILYYSFHCGYLLWIANIALVFCYLVLIFKYKEKIDIIDIIVYILLLLGFVSSLNAIDVETAFLGTMDRYEGFLTNISYYLIILCLRKSINRHNSLILINVFLGLGIFQSLYAIGQVFIRSKLFLSFAFPYMANALCGNPNYLGSYLLLTSLIGIYFGIYSNKHNVFYIVSGMISTVGLVLAQSTIPFLCFVIGLFIIFFYTLIKKRNLLKKCSWITASALVLGLFVTYISVPIVEDVFKDHPIPNYTIRDDLNQITYFFFPREEYSYFTDGENIYQASIEPEITFYQGRLYIWKNTLSIAKDNILFGVGYDNLSKVFAEKYEVTVDKAHNHYLNILVTNGIFSLIAYLTLFTIILIRGFKTKKIFTLLLSLITIPFFIHYFFSTSVIEVTPYFFMLIGVILASAEDNSDGELIYIKE